MKSRSSFQIIILASIFLVSGNSIAQKKWPGVVLYNLELNGVTKELILDPVVRISKGEFSYPLPIPPESWDMPDANKVLSGYFDRFNREEYPKGRKLDVYLDGNKLGSVKITQIDTVNSCSPVVTEVKATFFDSVNHPFTGHGLVITSLPSRKPVSNFPFDSTLEKSLFEYGKDEFIRRGVNAAVAARMEIKTLRCIDIDGDGQAEYFVSYFIIGEDVKHGEIESNMQYSWSVILKKTNDGYKEIYSHYPDPGIPEETHLYKFIDVIDIDGDGICEIVIQQVISMTSWDYVLLKKKGGVWQAIYEGAGGGC